jgi:hypothetical protein
MDAGSSGAAALSSETLKMVAYPPGTLADYSIFRAAGDRVIRHVGHSNLLAFRHFLASQRLDRKVEFCSESKAGKEMVFVAFLKTRGHGEMECIRGFRTE